MCVSSDHISWIVSTHFNSQVGQKRIDINDEIDCTTSSRNSVIVTTAANCTQKKKNDYEVLLCVSTDIRFHEVSLCAANVIFLDS